jgi:hypothetical protein
LFFLETPKHFGSMGLGECDQVFYAGGGDGDGASAEIDFVIA